MCYTFISFALWLETQSNRVHSVFVFRYVEFSFLLRCEMQNRRYEEGVLARQFTLFDDLEESEKILKEHKIISAFTGMVPQVRKSQLTAGKQPAVMRPPSPTQKNTAKCTAWHLAFLHGVSDRFLQKTSRKPATFLFFRKCFLFLPCTGRIFEV